MNILVVEDDSFKFSKIETLIENTLGKVKITRFDNIHDTVIYFESNIPDKIILDMSLPSHAAKVGEGSPLSMPAGGIEIILELKSLNMIDIPILILTQYPEIEIENEYYSIDESGIEIKNIYGINNLAVVLYENDSSDWKDEAVDFLRL
ncbi:MAG: hypothetical protein OEW89_00070 [Gammaproteobacteria bacterium]|nr:hypothetical protein [Gammaproteobacteria bacterium]